MHRVINRFLWVRGQGLGVRGLGSGFRKFTNVKSLKAGKSYLPRESIYRLEHFRCIFAVPRRLYGESFQLTHRRGLTRCYRRGTLGGTPQSECMFGDDIIDSAADESLEGVARII